MMISRDLITKLGRMAQKFPVVTLTGPRQSGKTMLLRHVFQDYRYVSRKIWTCVNLLKTTLVVFYPHMGIE